MDFAVENNNSMSCWYKNLVEDCDIAAFIIDKVGNFAFANNAFLEMFGYSKSEGENLRVVDFIKTPEKREYLAKAISKSDGVQDYSINLKDKRGEIHNCKVSISIKRNKSGEIESYLGHIYDFTEFENAKSELEYRYQFEKMITSISTHFINLSSEEIDAGIDYALEGIGEFVDADRAYLFIYSDDGREMSNTHEWCSENIIPQIDNLKRLQVDNYPYFSSYMNNFDVFHVPSVKDMPGNAQYEKDSFLAQDIKSMVVVPLVFSGSLRGFLGFDAVRGEKNWSEDTIALLIIVGEILIGAIERKRADQSIEKSERLYRTTINSMRDVIFVIDSDYTIQLSNFLNTEFSQFDSDIVSDGTGCNLFDFFPFITDDKKSEYEEVFLSGEMLITREETRLNDEVIRTETRKIPVIEDGITKRIVTLVRDITAREEAERALRESEERNRSLRNNIPVGLFRTSPRGRLLSVNPAAVSIFGYDTEEEMLAIGVNDLYADPVTRDNALGRLNREEYICDMELFAKRKDKSRFWVSVSASTIKNEEGDVLYYDGIVEDISIRREIEKKLVESEALFRTVFEHSSFGYYRLKSDGEIVMAGPSLVKMLGYNNMDELTGRTLDEVACPGYPRDKFNRLLEKEGCITGLESEWSRKDGSTISVRENARIFRDGDENVLFIEGAVDDISDRKRMEKKLRDMALFTDLDPNPIIRFDIDGGILMSNQSANQVFNLDQNKNIRIQEIMEGLDSLNPGDCIEKGTITSFFTYAGGRRFQFTLKGIPDLNVGHAYGVDLSILKDSEVDNSGLHKKMLRLDNIENESGSEAILIVDSDEKMLDSACRLLDEFEYIVLTARDERDAREIFRQKNDKIQMIILDQTLIKDLAEITEELLKIKPGLKIILSGNAPEMELMNSHTGSFYAGFIQRPVRLNDLLQKISRILRN